MINSLPAMPGMPRKGKTPRQCTCGCGLMTKGGRYVPGHDARHHGWAIRIAGGYDTTGITPSERVAAERAIRAGQWPELSIPPATHGEPTGE